MFTHLASLVGLYHTAIVLVVSKLLRDRVVHKVAELVGSSLCD